MNKNKALIHAVIVLTLTVVGLFLVGLMVNLSGMPLIYML